MPVKHTSNFVNIYQKKYSSMKLPEIIISILEKIQ
jgi:hypothetical protein